MGHPWFQGHADGKILLKLAGKSLRSPREASHCAPGIEVWGIKRKGEHPKRQGVWGPQSPGSVGRRLLAPLCRTDAEGKWPWLRLSARVNRTEAEDCKGPGERGRRVSGRSLSSWDRQAVAGFCGGGYPMLLPRFLCVRPAWMPAVFSWPPAILDLAF